MISGCPGFIRECKVTLSIKWIFDPAQLVVCQDMTQPFNHYFIATSYNTYLVEDMRGQSSIDGYLSALKRNCRFIEVDIWEPDPMIDGLTREPVVCSGIRTNPGVPLSLVLDTISETAFEKTRYPLFIRIEVHLSIDQQRLVCELLEQHLGQKLYRPKEDPVNWALPENVPSPKKFMNRIILSGVHSEQICPSSKAGTQIFEAIEEDEGFEFSPGRCQCSEYKILGALQDLIAPFAQSKNLQDFASIIIGENDKLNELCPRKHIVSMNEGTCLRMLMLNEQNELITTSHNNHSFARRYHEFLLRVTPNSSRIDSSNLNPQEFWNFGISLVALNYQTPGLMMDLLEGKFLANGGCGYVLKPPLMRKHGTFSPIDKMEGFAQVLHIKIHSAQQLPRPRASTAKGDSADPYIVLEVFGVPADCAEERTRTVRNDSFNPTFDESFQFEITVPEVALIRFLVLDDEFIDDDFIGQYTIPFECLQSGYRHIPLLNNEGDPLEHCTIFVHIAVTNRRGGGKPKKRGLSVRRMMNRVQTGMKAIGIKSVDDQFSKAMSHLSRFIEMKNQLESLLTEWQKESGLAPTSTIRQGLRLMHSRIVAASNSVGKMPYLQINTIGTQLGEDNAEFSAGQCVPSFSIIGCDEYHARVKAQGQIPETIEKSFTLLDDLLKCCSTIVDSTDELLSSVSEITRKIIEGCEDFAKFCTEAGLRGQKATRANENFNWNIKMCRTQIMLMTTTLAEAKAMLQQAFETAKMLEILEEENPNKNQSCD